jgi:hypothetical protein
MPLSGQYLWQTGQTRWKPISGIALTKALQGAFPPEFRTVLSFPILPDFEADQGTDGYKYRGPFYADFDAENIDDSIQEIQYFLRGLETLGVNLRACRFFSTGKKGFHIEVPCGVFMKTVPAEGVLALPAIYKGIAKTFAQSPVLDMQVYSQGKGRMWRVPNRQRENGKFKVPLTLEELRAITPESYPALVSAPREFPPLEAPEFAPAFGRLFEQQTQAVSAAKQRQSEAEKTRASAGTWAKRFDSKYPASLRLLCSGKIQPRPDAGWNQIALQLAAVAHSVGMTEEEMLDTAAPLIASHHGDGRRYGTPEARRSELHDKWRFTASGKYVPSVGALLAILPRGRRYFDLRGV